MPNDIDDSRPSETLAPETDKEPATNPEASARPAIAPPARLPDVPDDDELRSSKLAAVEPPEWFKASFIGQALSKFAGDAEDIRKGRNAQHVEQMTKLDKVVEDMGALAMELSANLETLSGEFRRHRDASNERDAEQDGRIRVIERTLVEIKADLRASADKQLADVARITELERLIAELKTNVPARPPEAPSEPT